MPSLFPGPLAACMVKSSPKKANIQFGVFKTIYVWTSSLVKYMH